MIETRIIKDEFNQELFEHIVCQLHEQKQPVTWDNVEKQIKLNILKLKRQQALKHS